MYCYYRNAGSPNYPPTMMVFTTHVGERTKEIEHPPPNPPPPTSPAPLKHGINNLDYKPVDILINTFFSSGRHYMNHAILVPTSGVH